MNITIINADSIFWAADKNIRLVNFDYIFEQVYDISTPDQIYLVGGFESNDPFNEVLKEIVRDNSDKPIIPVSSTNSMDGHHNPEAKIVDLLCRGTLSQDDMMTTRFTIVSADASSIHLARFLAKRGLIEPAAFILSDALVGFDEAAQLADIKHTISLKAESRTMTDLFAISKIMNLVKSDMEKEVPFYNTVSVLINKCKSYFSLPQSSTRLITLSLIHHGFLGRCRFTARTGEQRNGVILGEKAQEMFDFLEKVQG